MTVIKNGDSSTPPHKFNKVQAHLTLKIIKENQHKAVEIINYVLERIRAESGCLNFDFYKDITRRDVFLLIQEWESRFEFEKHLHSDEFRHILALIDLSSELPTISFKTISKEEGLEVITSLRKKVSNSAK